MVFGLSRTSSERRLSTNSSRQERVPETLQTVFLNSNRGKTVHVPPPERVASKTFFRNWFFQRQTSAPIVPRKQKQHRTFFFNTRSPQHRTQKLETHHESDKGTDVMNRRGSCQTVLSRDSSPAPQHSPESSPHPSPKQRSAQIQQMHMAAMMSQTPAKHTHIVPMVPVQMSPQGYLDSLLRSRGYSSQKYRVLETAYYSKPTALQIASYHVKLVEVMRQGDAPRLKQIIKAGLSRNPCNQHGESLVHAICRRGDYKLLQVMIDEGATVQVSDDHGRTPLHDACWSSSASFAAVDIVLQHDARLVHMMDARGATPLMYVRNDQWTSWLKFIRSRVDLYWPPRNLAEEGEQPPPPLTMEEPNTRPVPDPENALPLDLASMLASGRITPNEAEMLRIEDDEDESDLDSSYYSDSDYSESDLDESYDEEEDEMEECSEASDEEDNELMTSEGCPDRMVLSDESSDSPKGSSESVGSESDVSDDEISFDENEIAELIRGITSPRTQKCAWTSSSH